MTLQEIQSRGGSMVASHAAAARTAVIDPDPEALPAWPIRLSVVIPTYNERANLPQLLRRLCATLNGPLGGSYELIVVDDDSPDGTWELAEALTLKVPRLRVIRRRGEKGLSTAVVRGWKAARGEVLAVIDADLQHPPEVLAALWQGIVDGADLAVGSRHTEGGGLGAWSAARRALSSGARLLALMVLPHVVRRLTDPMSGCFMIKRSAIAGRPLNPLGYKILLEVLARGEVRTIHEVGYVFEVRRQGASKVTPRVYVDYLSHLLRLRLAAPGTARFLRFCAVGLGGVVVDMAVLFALGDPRALGLPLLLSKLAATETAIVHNFLWNDAVTFKDVSGRAPGARRKVMRFLRFNAICAAGVGLGVLLLYVQATLLGLDRYAANAVTVCLVAAWNYLWSVKVGWASPRPAEARDGNGSDAARLSEDSGAARIPRRHPAARSLSQRAEL